MIRFSYLFVFVSCIALFNCQPINRDKEPGDEKLYPNGTVVGKYSYVDEEGNPTHVRYYADDSSYGVELKSVKISGKNVEGLPFIQKNTRPLNTVNENIKEFKKGPEKSPHHDNIWSSQRKNLYRGMNNDNDINTCKKQYNPKPHHPDYDVYVQKELDIPLTCSKKEKISVYMDENPNRENSMTPNKYRFDTAAFDRNGV